MRIVLSTAVLLCSMPVDAGLQSLASTRVETVVRRAALKHALDADLLLAIYRVESGLKLGAMNKQTHDFGIAQINKHTIRAYKLNQFRLLTDLQYSADAGALVLADFKRRYGAREPMTYICRYNLGTRPLIGKRAELCLEYINKLRLPNNGHRTIAGDFK